LATTDHHINFQRSRIHYRITGSGPEWLFCFHGYGEDAAGFQLLENCLPDRFTIVAIDLPFHGQTDWQEGFLFEPEQLVSIIRRIYPFHKPVQLLGYSMGGRIAMQLAAMIPDQVKKVILVAPDGLHNNPWQWLATRTKPGNRLFKYLMQRPHMILKMMDLMGKTGLYSKKLLRFVHYYLDDAEQRGILYKRWTTMRKFSPGKHHLKSVLNQYQIPVTILFGKYDSIIRSRHGYRFQKGAENHVRVMEIEAGHGLLKEKHLPLLTRLILE
jgi:pimeloyl-ACP methyl ester carboxylesterase